MSVTLSVTDYLSGDQRLGIKRTVVQLSARTNIFFLLQFLQSVSLKEWKCMVWPRWRLPTSPVMWRPTHQMSPSGSFYRGLSLNDVTDVIQFNFFKGHILLGFLFGQTNPPKSCGNHLKVITQKGQKLLCRPNICIVFSISGQILFIWINNVYSENGDIYSRLSRCLCS